MTTAAPIALQLGDAQLLWSGGEWKQVLAADAAADGALRERVAALEAQVARLQFREKVLVDMLTLSRLSEQSLVDAASAAGE